MLSCSAGAEKAVKALFIRHGVKFPYIHDIGALLVLLERVTTVPDSMRQAARLTSFAVETRYPGTAPPVQEERYREIVKLATEVVRWAEDRLKDSRDQPTTR